MKIKKDRRNHYYGYIEDGEYHIEKLTGIEVYEFDSEETLLRYTSKHFDDDGVVTDGTVVTRQCQEDGYMYEVCDLNGKTRGYDRYDKNGYHVESAYNQILRWTYDTDGNLINEHCDNDDGLWWNIRYEYDKEGRIQRTVNTNRDKEVSMQRHYYSRDFMGNTVDSIVSEGGEFLESNIFDSRSGKLIQNKDERVEDEWVTILRYFNDEGEQVCCSSWHSDDIMETSHVAHHVSEYGRWMLRVEPALKGIKDADTGAYIVKPNSCHITVRDVEYFDGMDSEVIYYGSETPGFDEFV